MPPSDLILTPLPFATVALATWLLLEQTKQAPASGPLHVLFPQISSGSLPRFF